HVAALDALVLLIAAFLDCVFVAFQRCGLRPRSGVPSRVSLVALWLAPVVVWYGVAAALFATGHDYAGGVVATMLAPCLLPAILLALLHLSYGLHVVTWELLLRPLYSVVRHDLLRGRKALRLSLGLYLVGAAVRPELLAPTQLVRAAA